MIIDRRFLGAAAFLAVASLGGLCGMIHSPLGFGRSLLAGRKRVPMAGATGRRLRRSWPGCSCCSRLWRHQPAGGEGAARDARA